MIRPPDGMGMYCFAVLAGLRAAQLMRGCVARVDGGAHKLTVVAQLEVVDGKVDSPTPAASQDSHGDESG